jgi:hypothetical protein
MRHLPLVALPIALCILLITPGCSDDPSNDSNNGLSSLGLSLNTDGSDLIILTADPAEVVIDTTDPNAPTNPAGKFIGTTNLTATVMDTDGGPAVGVEVVFATRAGTLASGGSPVVTDDMGQAADTLEVTEDDEGTVFVGAIVGEERQTTEVTVTVIRPNQPPVANAGRDQTIECTSPGGTPVGLDGSASTDPDSTPGTNDDIVLFEWLVDDMVIAEGEVVRGVFQKGMTTVTLRVTDSEGEMDEDEVVIDVVDTTPPRFAVVPDPDVLWAPNHKMVDVHIGFRIVDACSVVPDDIEIILRDVRSSEPENDIGDGNTEPDIMGADIGTRDTHVQLRAERSGPGVGRTYTLVYTAEDPEGRSVRGRGIVTVPHDQGD